MAIDPALAKFFAEPDYEMRDRGMVANAIRGVPYRSKFEGSRLPKRFYSPDFVQIENEQPTLEDRPTWLPDEHPDWSPPAEKPPVGLNFPQIVDASGEMPKGLKEFFTAPPQETQAAQGVQSSPADDVDVIDQLGKGTGVDASGPKASDPMFQTDVKSIAAQATNWLVQNGKISSEDAARAAAGMELPGELVARIALGQAFLDQYPETRSAIEEGDATGVWDAFKGSFIDASDSAAIRRRIASGQDAMRRMLTGAALTGDETNEYIARYSPSWTDDSTSLLDKTDQLEREIRYIMGALMIGRGGQDLMNDLKDRIEGTAGRSLDNPLPKNEGKPAVSPEGWREVEPGIRIRVKK